MTNYTWKVTGGNFGAATSWNPQGTPTSSDGTFIAISTSLFGSGSAEFLNIYNAITVTISAALTTTIANDVLIGGGVGQAPAVVDVDAVWTNSCWISVGQDGFGTGELFVNAGGALRTSGLNIGTNYNNQTPNYTGSVTVQAGGAVTTSGGYDEVGVWQGGTGTLTVTGKGSSWTSEGQLNIGDNGVGTLYVENSATLTAASLDAGVSYDQPTIASGSGTVYIESGGVVTTTGSYQEIGAGATGSSTYATKGATAAVTIDGAGSKWIATNGQIGIGDAGSKSGSLTISNHGAVTATNSFYVGDEYNGSDGSYGTLLIESGGTAVSGGYNSIGANFSGAPTSTVTVTGSGSSWKTSGSVGVDGSGKVEATSGGTIDVGTEIDLSAGSLLQVDSSSTVEDGNVGGAALGYLTVDPDPNYYSNVYGDGTVDSDLIDNGKIYASEGTLLFQGPTGVADTGTIAGSGFLFVGTQATLSLSVASVAASLDVSFLGWEGTLAIEASGFAPAIHNFNAGDTIDIQHLNYVGGASSSYKFTPNGLYGAGTLVVTEGPTSVTLVIGSSPQTIGGELTLSKDAAGTGTDVTFTNGAAQSPFNLWSTLGSFFNTASGTVNGEEYGTSNATDGGTPIWTETETPASSYVSGSADNYTIVLATQDWLGDIQPEITIATDNNLIDPFVNSDLSPGNLAAATIFSNSATTGTGGVVYWKASTTAGDYAVDFEPLTVSYPSAPATTNLVTITGSPVTMIGAIAAPLTWTFSSDTSSSFVFAYTTKATSTTENLYMDAFNASGVATSGAPKLIASGLPDGTPYYVGHNSSGYGYRYLEVGGSLGTGLVGGTFNSATGALGTASLFLSLPNFTSFDGVSAFAQSNGDTLRFVEGVDNGKAVIQSFLNNSSTPMATFDLTSASDHFATTSVYDINYGSLDYVALAYTDAGKVHLELLNEHGVQIGGDYVVPGVSSFLRLHTMQGSDNSASTRVELDYKVANPNGGQQIEGFIYDTASYPYVNTLSGSHLYDGSPFDDTFTWGVGVYTIDGGGGSDTLSATNLSTSHVTLSIDSTGEVVVKDGSGDVDTLRRFSTIVLSDATVTIGHNTLTQKNANGTKIVSTFNITGQSYVEKVQGYTAEGGLLYTKEYNASGTLVGLFYGPQDTHDFNGDGISDIFWRDTVGADSIWDLTAAGGHTAVNPGTVSTAYEVAGVGDFNHNGVADILWRDTATGADSIWYMTPSGGHTAVNPGTVSTAYEVAGVGDFNGDGVSDILWRDTATGADAIWDMTTSGGHTAVNPGTVSTAWEVAGIGDFNGDGVSDILWRNTSTGADTIWDLTSAGGHTTVNPGTVSTAWEVAGIGDFNGDGVSDILWRNTATGADTIWDLTAAGGHTTVNPGTVSTAYQVASIGDFNGDGVSDILWRDGATGADSIWDMNPTGGHIAINPGTVATNWKVAA